MPHSENHGEFTSRPPAVFTFADAPTAPISETGRALLEECAAGCVSIRRPAQVFPAGEAELEALESKLVAASVNLPVASGDDPQEREFERRFVIIRTTAADGEATGLACALIAGTRLMNGSAAEPPEQAILGMALRLGVRQLLNMALPEQPLDRMDAHQPLEAYPELEQWRDGHIVFIALMRSLLRTHHALAATLRAGDLAASSQHLRDAAGLFHASAVALRHTGAMGPETYEAIVRPTMEPPYVMEKFSGTWLAEHRRLLALAHSVAELPHFLSPALEIDRDAYFFALNTAYAAHRHTCRRVTGEQSSLAARLNPKTLPGHVSLTGFADRALRRAGYSAANNNQRLKKTGG